MLSVNLYHSALTATRHKPFTHQIYIPITEHSAEENKLHIGLFYLDFQCRSRILHMVRGHR